MRKNAKVAYILERREYTISFELFPDFTFFWCGHIKFTNHFSEYMWKNSEVLIKGWEEYSPVYLCNPLEAAFKICV
jgi:hypothetical protein